MSSNAFYSLIDKVKKVLKMKKVTCEKETSCECSLSPNNGSKNPVTKKCFLHPSIPLPPPVTEEKSDFSEITPPISEEKQSNPDDFGSELITVYDERFEKEFSASNDFDVIEEKQSDPHIDFASELMDVYDKYFEKEFGASTPNFYVTDEKFDLDDDEKESMSSIKNIFEEKDRSVHHTLIVTNTFNETIPTGSDSQTTIRSQSPAGFCNRNHSESSDNTNDDEFGKVSHSTADGESDVKTWDTDGEEFDAISSSRESLSPLPVGAVFEYLSSSDSSSSKRCKPSSDRHCPIDKEDELSSEPSTGSKDKGTNPDMKENKSSNQGDPVKVGEKIPYWAR